MSKNKPQKPERMKVTLESMAYVLSVGVEQKQNFPECYAGYANELERLQKLLAVRSGVDDLKLSESILQKLALVLSNQGLVKSEIAAINLYFDEVVDLAEKIAGDFVWVEETAKEERTRKSQQAAEQSASKIAKSDAYRASLGLSRPAVAVDVTEGTYTKADLRAKTGLGDTSITKYTKTAGVEIPLRGGKSHRYTSEETRKILIAIRAGTQDARIERRCNEALSELT